MPKEVIDPKQAAAVAADPKTPRPADPVPAQPVKEQPRRKVWRFAKTETPAQVVELPSGTKIQFRVVKTQHNGYSPVGTFETEDEKVAQELAAFATKEAHLFVFPV